MSPFMDVDTPVTEGAQSHMSSWSFDLLPLELKRNIALRCRQQDEWIRACLDSVSMYSSPSVKRDVSNLTQHVRDLRQAYGSSAVGALFRVSRAWSAAAAPFRFSRCKLSKTTSLLFRFRIAPLYGQYFHTLEFDTIHQEGLQALLLLLPHMPNIVELDLHPDGFERVLDADARSTYGCEVLRLASLEGDSPLGFKPLLSSVATIHFELGSMRALGKLLRAAKSLRELHVYPKWPNRPVLPADELDDILASSPQLEALHLAVPLTRSAALDHSTASPLLRTLTLQVSGYCLPVAARFADSLERLALVFSGYGGRENVIHTFPQVKTLELTLAEQSGAQEEFLACLASINPATYPALQTLILRPKSIQVEQAYRIMHGVRQMVENLDETDPGNPLRLIHICDSLCPLPASSVDTLRSALERPGRKLTAGPMEPFVNSFTFHAEYNRAVGEGWPCEAAEAAASIDVTLSYVQEWFARAKATGNEADLARLAVALERAELERVVRTGADASY